MALIQCYECKRQVSDQAPACPHCGRPIIPPIVPPITPRRIVKIPKKGFICEACGEVGWPRKIVPGSFLIEVLLWLLLIVPGLIYTIWRLTSCRWVCPRCRAHMVPLGSAGGQRLVHQFFPSHEVQFH